MYIIFILFRIVSTGAVNKQSARFQCVPYVVDDTALTGGTKVDVCHAPFAGTVGVLAEHSFAGTGDIGNNNIKQMSKAPDIFGIVVRDDIVRISPFGDIFSQDITAGTDHFVADQQTAFG